MAKLYRYYQAVGGKEDWKPIQAEQDLALIRPTFATVLAVDTLLPPTPTREEADGAKYSGPMYFDLDSSEIQDSIDDAKLLVQRLQGFGLQPWDLEIYLSGKKGLHVLIPEPVFNQKPQPTTRLFDVYKEMAYRFATPSTDLVVYTGKKGRMLRTCYNLRENGNYKVPISLQELEVLTPDTYDLLCKTPRVLPPSRPEYRFQFALVYEEAVQKAGISKKRKKPAPVTPRQLQGDFAHVEKVLAGESTEGFNVVSMQLALYARESNWTADELCSRAQGLIQNTSRSDGRYNTPHRRDRELRNMLAYVEDNFSYEYNSAAYRKLVTTAVSKPAGDPGAADEFESLPVSGIYTSQQGYYVKSEDGKETTILSYPFTNVTTLSDPESGMLLAMTADTPAGTLPMTPDDFQGSGSLQRQVSRTGASFTGSDIHARKLMEMLHQEAMRNGQNAWLVEKEGVAWFKSPRAADEEMRKGFLIYSDAQGVHQSMQVQKQYLLKFNGYPSPEGKFHSDIGRCATLEDFLQVPENRERAETALWNLFRSQPPDVLGKILGWQVSCFYRSVFHQVYGKFPLLHVVGQAGSGKTETNLSLVRMHYHHTDPAQVSPTSTVFAIQSYIMASSSIPLIIDEYKPHEMTYDKHHALKLLLRDVYNARPVIRGGGSRGKEGFANLSEQSLTAPVMFIAEAVESETALLERVILATFRRLPGLRGAQQFAHFQKFSQDREILSHIGAYIVQMMLARVTKEAFRDKFDVIYAAARQRFCLQPGDLETLSAQQIKLKSHGRERIVYNYAVAEFGLGIFSWVLSQFFGDKFAKDMAELRHCCYDRMSDLVSNTVPEYIKVLQHMGDQTLIAPDSPARLHYGFEYQLRTHNGKRLLELAVRPAYNKYRIYSKLLGVKPLYNGEDSMYLALKDCGQFYDLGIGTKNLPAQTIVLDYDSLLEAGGTIFVEK